jgi:hypothetical protein
MRQARSLQVTATKVPSKSAAPKEPRARSPA